MAELGRVVNLMPPRRYLALSIEQLTEQLTWALQDGLGRDAIEWMDQRTSNIVPLFAHEIASLIAAGIFACGVEETNVHRHAINDKPTLIAGNLPPTAPRSPSPSSPEKPDNPAEGETA